MLNVSFYSIMSEQIIFQEGIMIMKLYLRRRLHKGLAIVCTLAVVCPLIPVRAEDSASLSQKIAEQQTELEGINQEMLSISDEIQSIEMQSDIMSGEVLRTEEALAVATANEEQQYEEMKARIKYLYETGNSSLLELLFTAESMADFLNKAEFIQNISDYDRDMLDELREAKEDIATKQETLQNQQKALSDLQGRLSSQKDELQKKAESTSTDLEAYNALLEQVRAQETAALGYPSGTDGSTVQAEAMQVSESEEKLLAAILECEAYQDYNSVLAVATVILNRVNDPRFPNSITEVVYASNQFEPVTKGSLDAALTRGPRPLSCQVAKEALSGKRLAAVADCYYFLYAGSTDRPGVNVGNNLFFRSW